MESLTEHTDWRRSRDTAIGRLISLPGWLPLCSGNDVWHGASGRPPTASWSLQLARAGAQLLVAAKDMYRR